MKTYKIFQHLTYTLLLVLSLFGSRSGYALITGAGQPVDALSFPGIVRITLPNAYFLDLIVRECTGIVLEPRRVLTTSDCVSEQLFVPGIPYYTNVSAGSLRVHPVPSGEIGGLQVLPAVQQALVPNFEVTDVIIHPQNLVSLANLPGREYQLAILYLKRDIDVWPATLYDGSSQFNNMRASMLGWTQDTRIEHGATVYYDMLRKVDVQISPSLISQTALSYTLTNSVSLTSADNAIPVYTSVNGHNALIGLNLFGGEISNVVSMNSFIKQHAPNTQFLNESSMLPVSRLIETTLWQLLLDD